MKSLAIWYEPSNNHDDRCVIDLHFNDWKLRPIKKPKGKSKRYLYYLDVGLMLHNANSAKAICLFIPNNCKDATGSVEDLGVKLQDDNVLTAVFNEKYNFQPVSGTKLINISDSESGEHKFRIVKLDVKHDINITSNYGGTILKITVSGNHDSAVYYRFRLKNELSSGFKIDYTPKDSIFERVSSNIELIDFRINDNRNLHISLLEEMAGQQSFCINKIHYFVVRDVEDELVIANNNDVRIRQLEENIWTSYVGDANIKYKTSIAYHLKNVAKTNPVVNANDTAVTRQVETKYISEFSGLLKFRYAKYRVWVYVLAAFGVGMFFEVAGNILYDWLKALCGN